ncbi:MAG: cytidine deaminase [Candidatus Diapherotrites archaeon]|nr:cytidine deaminase [Candidatus Diapherotrites archaeon]
MRFYKLSKEDLELIKVAERAIRKNRIESKALSSSVGAALITNKGNVYKGVNIESHSSAPTSICAETGAIASMFASGERKIKTIVAVHMRVGWKRGKVLQPCGACRHIISQFGNPWVIISKTKKTKLSELYPFPVK